MRQVSIPKNVVAALNDLFDENPMAIEHLLETRILSDAVVLRHNEHLANEDRAAAGLPVETPSTPVLPAAGPHISVLDIINAVLDSVAPGKRVATIHGPDGFEGFALARERKSATPDADENDS